MLRSLRFPHRRFRFLEAVLLLSLFCPIAATARAQAPAGSVGGAVLDPLGARIPGAHVTLRRDGRQVADTKADAKGEYVFHDLTRGRYQIEADAGGFTPQTVDPFFVGAHGRAIVNVTLPVGREEQQVVVTAAATATPASQVGASVTVLDARTLETLDKPDVLEALRLVPGMSIVQIGARHAQRQPGITQRLSLALLRRPASRALPRRDSEVVGIPS